MFRLYLLSVAIVVAVGLKPHVTVAADTSFEENRSGRFDQLTTDIGTWVPITGASIVDNKHAKTGKQCLQISGDRSIVELQLADGVATNGMLSFWAERWTKRTPFQFRIEKQVGDQWKEIYNGDTKIKVGRAFLSEVQVELSDPRIERLRFLVKSPPDTGVLIDDVRFVEPKPQEIASVDVIAFTLPALVHKDACALLKLNIQTTGTLKPISVAAIQASLNASTDVGDIAELGLVRGEANDSFAGGKVLAVARPPTDGQDCSFMVDSSDGVLREGDNYIWIVCKLNTNADIDHFVGAKCKSVRFSNGQTIAINSPASIQRMGVAVRDGGDDDVHTFRIPGLVTTNNGTLIGVYDVRHRGGGDLPGDIDVGMSRSVDGGRTWAPMKIIMNMGDDPDWRYDGIGDPTVMVDRTTGTIWCAATWSHGNRSWNGSQPGMAPEDTGQFMLVKSDDDGVTWSAPINITQQVKQPQWSFILQGPGKGITMADGTLVLPAQYQDPPNGEDKKAHRLPHSTFIFSRDHGQTWTTATGAWDDTTESQVVELDDGQLMINCRNNRLSRRAVMTTKDMGNTWTEHSTHNRSLIEPGTCMASLINVGREWKHLQSKTASPQRTVSWNHKLLLFSNPDSLRGRNHITIKASKDAGATWPAEHHLLLDEQNGRGYSCLTMIDSETVGILYEGSQSHMTFQRIKINDILNPPKNHKTKNPAVINQPVSEKTLSFARPFGDHMVLQANQPTTVWGRAPANKKLSISIGDMTSQNVVKSQCTVDSNGKWAAKLPAIATSGSPKTMTATCDGEVTMIKDVLLGEVWFCAGQSNMQWPLAKSYDAQKTIAESSDPLLRLHHCQPGASGSSGVYSQPLLNRLRPDAFSSGQWKVAGPDSAGEFSAVGYFFAQKLRRDLNVPIGMINVSVGGTPIESWVSPARLLSDPHLKKMFSGNWLDNPILDAWCKTRAKTNLRRGLQGELVMQSGPFGPNHSFKPGFMYEAGIKPFTGFAIRGGLWYQGESNADTPQRTKVYDDCFPLLVADWRTSFRNPDLPIGFVQLPALKRPNWPVFREYQRRSLSKLEHVGMAITIDTGNKTNVHPADKRPVGQRLATWALSQVYAKVGLPMGPLYRSKQVRGDTLVLSFDHTGNQLKTADGDDPNQFQIAANDGKFYPATVQIDGPTVILKNPKVTKPIHARYAWSDFPTPRPNLVNAEGLPASPFTTETDIPGDVVVETAGR